MLDRLKTELAQLDALINDFRSHPMYSEWLDKDEVTLLVETQAETDESLVDDEAFWIDQLENKG